MRHEQNHETIAISVVLMNQYCE